MKVHEENNPGSMQNYKFVREVIGMVALKLIIQEVKELKEICCSEAERTQGPRADDFSPTESQSTVNQLTDQIHELQERERDRVKFPE